jgi:hypothetical protein
MMSKNADIPKQSLSKSEHTSEQVIYDRLKKSAEEIRLYKEGKIKLQNAREFLDELYS